MLATKLRRRLHAREQLHHDTRFEFWFEDTMCLKVTGVSYGKL
jgi:hypothetical protein